MTQRSNNIRIGQVLIGAAAGAAGATLFFIVGAVAMNFAIDLLHLSRREGGDAYATVFVGLLLGLIGFVAMLWLALRWRGLRGWKVLLGGLASTALLLALMGAAFGTWYSLQPHILNPNGAEPLLALQVRAPSGFNVEAIAAMTAELSTDRNGADVQLKPPDASTPTVRAGVLPLYFRTSQRLLAVKLPDTPTRVYRLHLPADPRSRKYDDWSQWQPPDSIDNGEAAPLKRAGTGPDFEIRYRMAPVED